VLLFVQTCRENKISWVPNHPKSSFLMNIIVEIRLTSCYDINPYKSQQITSDLIYLQEKFTSIHGKYDSNPSELLIQFDYKTEDEWEVALEICGILPLKTSTRLTQANDDKICSQVFSYSAISLMKVWMRRFGVQEARKVAEETCLWKKIRNSSNY